MMNRPIIFPTTEIQRAINENGPFFLVVFMYLFKNGYSVSYCLFEDFCVSFCELFP